MDTAAAAAANHSNRVATVVVLGPEVVTDRMVIRTGAVVGVTDNETDIDPLLHSKRDSMQINV